MKIKQLKAKVQKEINKEVEKNSKHFSLEPMNNQIEALIKVLAPLLKD